MSTPDDPAANRFRPPAQPTIPAFWRAVVEAHGDLVAVRHDSEAVTYRELDDRSAALARGLLEDGAGKGTRIGLLAPNGVDWVVGWLAINRIGGIAVLLSTFSAAGELAYAVRHADVAILLCAQRYLRHDYVARLEEAFPGLAASDGAEPLALVEVPYLRSIWFDRDVARSWRRGSFADLAARGGGATGPDLLAAIEAAVSPADLALVIYTSGSTAMPKGVVHTQGTAVRKTLYMAEGNGIIPANTALGDRSIVTSPFFWIGGLLSLAGAFVHGATVVCVDEHTPQILLRAVRETRATHLNAYEAVLRAIRNLPEFEPGDFDGLKPHTVNQRAFLSGEPREKVPNSLGMTETFGPHSGDNFGGLLPPGVERSVGPALDGVEYRIVDPDSGKILPAGEFGELYVRAPWLLDGMYKKERFEVFDADGFYPTGDQCQLRPDGYLIYGARISGMIKTSGANVSPEEVEQAILAQPEVADAAVFGLRDPAAGEIVVAAVAINPGATLDEAELKRRVRLQVSSFKAPKRVVFLALEDFPRTPSNKIRKPTLAAMIQERLAQEAQTAALDR